MRLPLLRSPHVHFHAFDLDDCSRFVRLFRETWRLIPLPYRRSILRHWRRRGYANIEIAPYWSGYTPRVSGQCGNMGQQVRFYSHFVRLASDDDIRYVIAHELVHVWQWASKGGTFHGAEVSRYRDACEVEARKLGLQWVGLTRCPRETPALKAHNFNVLVELVKNPNALIPTNKSGDRRRAGEVRE